MLRERVAEVAATFFYVGLVPYAPGTAGTVAAAVLYVVVLSRLGPLHYAAFLLVVAAVGVWSAGVMERAVGTRDPRCVVIDEVCGFGVTMALVPEPAWWTVVLGFVLFRVFDVLKPQPARALERLPGGAGVVADDVMAGLYANLVLQAVTRLA